MEENFITGEDRDKIQKLLTADEKLLWCGKPRVRYVTFENVISMLGGSLFLAVSLYMCMELADSDRPLPTEAVVFISIFLLFPLFLIIVLPIQNYRAQRRCLYALTDKQAIVLQAKENHFYPLAPYMALRVHIPENKCGSIVFEEKVVNSGKSRRTVEYGFLHTPDAATALDIMRRLLEGKVSEADKPAELLRQEYEQKCKKMAALYPPLLICMGVAVLIFTACLYFLLTTGEVIPTLFGMMFACVMATIAFPSFRMARQGRKMRR